MSTHSHKLAARQQMAFSTVHTEQPILAQGHATEVLEALKSLLVEVLDVALCARHARWNVRGPHCLPLHDLLEEVGETLDRQADRIARRIGALGGTAHGTAHHIATRSSIKPYPVEVTEGQDHLEAVALRLGLLSAEARLSIYDAKRRGDPVTIKVIVEANAMIDHVLWLVESHHRATH